MLKYCEKTTSGHSVFQHNPDCQCAIKHLIKAEGGKGNLFKYDRALNLDKVEEKLAQKEKRRGKKKTMDVFWGVSENEINGKAALIEFKFNVKNPKNLKKTELEGKVKGSMIIIGTEIPVYNKYCFVRAYMLSFARSFPTYPCAIRTVVTAVMYMALQTGYLLSL